MRHAIASMLRTAALVAALCSLATPVRAEEGGAGHYAVGAASSFIDTLSGVPGSWGVANFFMYYDGRVDKTVAMPKDGQVVFGMDARAWVDSVLALYETKVKMLGGDYSVGLALPLVSLDVNALVTGPNGGQVEKHDSATGLGDILVYPFMLVWKKNDLKYDVRFGVYAPTGAYEKGRLANLGKNYWTFEPAVSVSWLSSKIGTEVTAFAGFDLNTRNDATDYLSGTTFHLDGTVAQHLPLGKDTVIGAGGNFFYLHQIEGDSYSGARVFGGFEGNVSGIGPEISLITRFGHVTVAAELKWLPDSHVQNRLEGDTVWLKVGVGF